MEAPEIAGGAKPERALLPPPKALAAAVLGRPPGLSEESEQVSAPDSRLAGPAELAKPPRPLRPATRGPGKLRERQLRGREDAPQPPRAAHGLPTPPAAGERNPPGTGKRGEGFGPPSPPGSEDARVTG